MSTGRSESCLNNFIKSVKDGNGCRVGDGFETKAQAERSNDQTAHTLVFPNIFLSFKHLRNVREKQFGKRLLRVGFDIATT